jgi:hypothetical protein
LDELRESFLYKKGKNNELKNSQELQGNSRSGTKVPDKNLEKIESKNLKKNNQNSNDSKKQKYCTNPNEITRSNLSNDSTNSKPNPSKSFFENFTTEKIFNHWHSSNTLLEIAKKLGFTEKFLSRKDYEYIESIKTREVWHNLILSKNRQQEKERNKFILNLPKNELKNILDSDGIETINHLSLHFLRSPKHGRKILKERIQELQLNVKSQLYKGMFGISQTPRVYPKLFYQKRIRLKPINCEICGFVATIPKQIELHHEDSNTKSSKNNKNKEYYTNTNIIALSRNCHSLEHRTGERLKEKCGKWHKDGLPGNQKYSDPDDIFTLGCQETYRVQKE